MWFSLRKSESPGFEREVLEGFARLHKLRFEVVPIARWEEAIPMLLRQEGDVLGGISATPERPAQRVDFTIELLPARSIVVTQRPQARDPVARRAARRAARDRAGHDLGRSAREGRRSASRARCASRTSPRRSRRSASGTPTRP